VKEFGALAGIWLSAGPLIIDPELVRLEHSFEGLEIPRDLRIIAWRSQPSL